MREWRKIYASMLDSEQVAQLSDSAFCLFTILIIAQDDSAYYPWTPLKIRSLTLSRSWSLDETKGYADELATAGLVLFREGGVWLTSGEQRNGQPRNDRRKLTYQRLTTDIPVTDAQACRGEERGGGRLSRNKRNQLLEERRGEQRSTTGNHQPSPQAPAAAALETPDSQEVETAARVWEDSVGRPITERECQALADIEASLETARAPTAWLVDAIKEAAAHGKEKVKIRYIERILERWHEEGRDNGHKKQPDSSRPGVAVEDPRWTWNDTGVGGD